MAHLEHVVISLFSDTTLIDAVFPKPKKGLRCNEHVYFPRSVSR